MCCNIYPNSTAYDRRRALPFLVQQNVTDRRRRLGNFAIAVTEPRDSGTHSQSHIVQTTTLTVDEGCRGELAVSGENS